MNHTCLDTMPERVKFARKEAGFKNQSLIADAMGITREAYAWYETSKDMPSEHLPKFHKATGYSIHWLLTGEGPQKKEEDQTPLAKLYKNRVERLQKLSEPNRQEYIKMSDNILELLERGDK